MGKLTHPLEGGRERAIHLYQLIEGVFVQVGEEVRQGIPSPSRAFVAEIDFFKGCFAGGFQFPDELFEYFHAGRSVAHNVHSKQVGCSRSIAENGIQARNLAGRS